MSLQCLLVSVACIFSANAQWNQPNNNFGNNRNIPQNVQGKPQQPPNNFRPQPPVNQFNQPNNQFNNNNNKFNTQLSRQDALRLAQQLNQQGSNTRIDRNRAQQLYGQYNNKNNNIRPGFPQQTTTTVAPDPAAISNAQNQLKNMINTNQRIFRRTTTTTTTTTTPPTRASRFPSWNNRWNTQTQTPPPTTTTAYYYNWDQGTTTYPNYDTNNYDTPSPDALASVMNLLGPIQQQQGMAGVLQVLGDPTILNSLGTTFIATLLSQGSFGK